MRKVVAIVQARLGSMRFPRKVLEEVDGTPIFMRIITEANKAREVDAVCLAVPEKDKDTFCLDSTCRDVESYSIYAGDEEDVFSRFLGAARQEGADIIVRLCADNPCVKWYIIDEAVKRWKVLPEEDREYTVLVCDGGYVEVFSGLLLEEMDTWPLSAYDREHVTSFVTEAVDPIDWQVVNFHYWTVDTPEDLERIRRYMPNGS